VLVYGRPGPHQADHTQVRFWSTDVERDVAGLAARGVVLLPEGSITSLWKCTARSGRTGGGPAAPGHGPRVSGHPASVGEGASEQHLDVGVQAPELVGGPSGQGVVDLRVDAQQHLFALTAHV
jgi:hypothetical protein